VVTADEHGIAEECADRPTPRHRHLYDFREEPSTSIRPAALAQRGVDSFLEPAQLHFGYRESTNARFHFECRGDVPVGLPTDLCVKGYFADCSDTAAASRTAGVPGALFYRHLADGTGVPTLDCVYAEVDPVTQHGVIITGTSPLRVHRFSMR
jgi:hypothetical protein